MTITKKIPLSYLAKSPTKMKSNTIEEQVERIRKVTKAALKSKESAIKFLIEANIMTRDMQFASVNGIRIVKGNAKSSSSNHRVS